MKILKIVLLSIIVCSSVTTLYAKEEETVAPEDIDKAGTYFVPISASTMEEEKWIRIHVTFPKTTISDENQEGIDAHDFQTTKTKIEKSTDTELITLANAYAWNTLDGKAVPITSVQVTKENKTDVAYTVNFKTDKGTNTSINVYVVETTNLSFTSMYRYDTPTKEINIWILTGALLMILVVPCIIIMLLYLFYYRNLKKVEKVLYE